MNTPPQKILHPLGTVAAASPSVKRPGFPKKVYNNNNNNKTAGRGGGKSEKVNARTGIRTRQALDPGSTALTSRLHASLLHGIEY